jgi:DNA-binding CsgD family transcriptional regulator
MFEAASYADPPMHPATAPGAPPLAAALSGASHALTPRETEVLRLVAAGLTDRQIGEALFISHTTARTHVRNLLAKLGVNTRTAAAAYAHRHGLG